jgi:CheY-like chemotaxis protein
MKLSAPTQAKGAGRTILVVDDDAPILHCIRRILEQAKYVVLTSPSGDHAWTVIERGDAGADLVLADMVMPGSIDGLTLAAKIRQRERKLPVLFMTGAVLKDSEYLAEVTRNKLVLRKPFSPKQLIDLNRPLPAIAASQQIKCLPRKSDDSRYDLVLRFD